MDSKNKKNSNDDSIIGTPADDSIVGVHTTEGMAKVRVNMTAVEVPASVARAARRVEMRADPATEMTTVRARL